MSIASGKLSRQASLVLAVGLVAAPLPLILDGQSEAIAVRVLIFAVLAAGWNIMSGFGGMFSFGHAAYFGIGAYASTYLLVTHDVSPWLGMVAGALVAILFGLGTSYMALRYSVRDAYFALGTFAFAQMLLILASNLDFLNSNHGLNVPIESTGSWAKFQFPLGDARYFWIPLAMLVATLLAKIGVFNSRAGQFIIASRDDEVAAASLGVRVMRYRMLAVSLSAAVSAAAGTVYAQYYLYIDPTNAFGAHISLEAIIPTVVGGLGTIWGPAVGAVALGPISALSSSLLRDPPEFLSFLEGQNGLDVILYAVLLIIIVLYAPKGLYGEVRERLER